MIDVIESRLIEIDNDIAIISKLLRHGINLKSRTSLNILKDILIDVRNDLQEMLYVTKQQVERNKI